MHCLYLNLLYHIIFLASSTGRFQFFCCWHNSENNNNNNYIILLAFPWVDGIADYNIDYVKVKAKKKEKKVTFIIVNNNNNNNNNNG